MISPVTETQLPADCDCQVEAAVTQMLDALGEDPSRDGLVDTPGRVARAMREMFRGLHEDPAAHLGRIFDVEHDEPVILRDIVFFSLCEHHLLPFYGKAHIAYVPQDRKVVGLSKLARTVDVFARRPQVQERLTQQIADAIDAHLNPAGVCVAIEAEHMCMKMRGVSKPGATMVTTACRGAMKNDPQLRREMMAHFRGQTL